GLAWLRTTASPPPRATGPAAPAWASDRAPDRAVARRPHLVHQQARAGDARAFHTAGRGQSGRGDKGHRPGLARAPACRAITMRCMANKPFHDVVSGERFGSPLR